MLRNLILHLIFYKLKLVSWLKHDGIVYNGFAVIFAFPKSSIEIGKGTTLNGGFFSNLLGLYQRIIIVARNGGTVKIGDNCVVGAGSVVSGVFPDNCVIAGNSAKVIKQLPAVLQS